jgi:hypothetical protein
MQSPQLRRETFLSREWLPSYASFILHQGIHVQGCTWRASFQSSRPLLGTLHSNERL